MENKLQKVQRLYSDNIKNMGISSKSVGWKDDESHHLRFDKLTLVLSQNKNKTITINDLGCGYGAMFQYLKSLANQSIKKYTGYDISEEMIEAAIQYTDPEICEYHLTSKVQNMADYTFVSGTFNVRFEKSFDEWTEYIVKSLDNINQYSKKGFAFNLLTSYVDYREDHLYYGNPCFYFNYCKQHYSKKVSLIHDYDLFEWTMLVFKE